MLIWPRSFWTRMEHIQPYLDYFSANPEWAIVIVFLIAFGEALLIIGLFVPSTAVLVGAGMLVGTGHLGFWPVFWATAIGAIAGDQVSYWVGRLYGQRLKTMWPLNKYTSLMIKGEDFVRMHGGKSIAIGRFVPGVKAVVPGIVGMLGMNQLFFIFVNVTSGLFWTAAHVFPGILLGQGLALAGDLSGQLLVVVLVLLVVLGLASWFIRKLATRLQPYTHRVLASLSTWAKSRKNRAMHRFGKAIHPDNPRAPAVALLLLIAIASLVGLVDLVSGFVLRNAASNLDVSVATLMSELRNAPADAFMIPLTMMAERPVIWATGLAIAAWLILWRSWRVAVLFLVVMGIAEFASLNLNRLVSSPEALLYGGFTSIPTLMAGLVFGMLAVIAGHAMKNWSKVIVATLCVCIVVAIAFSRVYLGAEWLSGVLIGGLLALVLASLFGMAIEAIPARRIRPVGLVGFAGLVFVAVGMFHVNSRIQVAEQRYAPRTAIESFTAAEFGSGAWTKLANRRVDLAGSPEEVFAAQWVGGLEHLSTTAQQQGWKALPTWRWQDAFFYLDAKATLTKLPPRPMLHQGLKAKLTMVLETPNNDQRRLVLRAYKSHVTVSVDGRVEPVFLISVTPEASRSSMGLYAMPTTLKLTSAEQQRVIATLQAVPNVIVLAHNEDPQKPSSIFLAKP
jgi:membrane protein DedA with SNARE-associated domain/membrane-associated phospholipid phosphatase